MGVAPRRIGKYEIVEQIGMGGFGVVYKAWDPFIQRWVALKTCTASDEEATKRFFREAQLAGALQHPNITLIFDFGIEGNTPYFVQEFLSGTDLDELLKQQRLSLAAIVGILVQTCNGLEFAHSRGIVHRDIKPANVRVLEDGSVKIMDFGIAKLIESDSHLTKTGVALGTAGYLSPEQLTGKPLDARTDIFSLGVMAYELITGVRPFVGPNISNVIYQILNQDPLPPRRRNSSCPELLESAVLRCLAKNPEHRYASVRDLSRDLKRVQASLPTASKETTSTGAVRAELSHASWGPDKAVTAPTELAARPLQRLPADAPTQAPVRRRRGIAVLAAAAAVLLLGSLAVLMRAGLGTAPAGTAIDRAFPATPPPLPSPTVAVMVLPTPEPTAAPTPPPAPVAVDLFVDPPSLVEVEGRSLGKVQFVTVHLVPGRHRIRQVIEGYRDTTTEVDITPTTRRLNLTLPPFGLLTVLQDLGQPTTGVTIFLDGEKLGGLPLLERKVAAGERTLKVVWPDGGVFEETITISAAGHTRLTVWPRS